MKREGWQHGMVMTNPKLLKQLDVNPKAPTKPTNASKMTGKCRKARCGSCHLHPATKAKDKAKGAHKLRACDVALNHRLVTWRVVDDGCDSRGVPDYKGVSATAVLAYLSGSRSSHESYDEDNCTDSDATFAGDKSYTDMIVGCTGAAADEELGHGLGIEAMETLMQTAANDVTVGGGENTDIKELKEKNDADDIPSLQTDNTDADDEEEDMGFCMVGITFEYSDGEDWLVVEEM